jgi:phosphoribosyl-AMP cyclohydrolase
MKASQVKFDKDGLIPVVIQEDHSNAVLMLAFMNTEAFRLTRETGRTHFWSRSRQQLWKKGETSGHEQIVRSIHVNCYEDSLLIRVDQVGAACHTGFPTCFYRELTAENELVETEARVFDPATVYGSSSSDPIRVWIGAYQWLADHDLEAVSNTSRLLRSASVEELAERVADELEELAGVLDGTHAHSDFASDVTLEGSQVLYWTVLFGLRLGVPTERLIDIYCTAAAESVAPQRMRLVVSAIGTAGTWSSLSINHPEYVLAPTVALVAQVARSISTDLDSFIAKDLAEFRDRPYLADYFAEPAS